MITEVKLTEISENVTTGDIVQLLVEVGDIVEKEQPIVELETDKATFEMPAPEKGKVTEIAAQKGQTLKVGDLILKIETEFDKEQPPAQSEKPQTAPKQKKQTSRTPETEKPQPSASPAIRQLARELNVEIDTISPTGPDGMITEQDIRNAARPTPQEKPTPAASKARPLPDFSKIGPVTREPISPLRKAIAQNLSATWSTVPQVTHFDQADITELEEFRTECSQQVADAGGKLTITAIIIKAIAQLLAQYPKFNASLDSDNNQLILKQYYNIAVAVDTERGLLVPVITDVSEKSITDISIELNQLSEKARAGKLSPDQMTKGNFTISNLGGIGGTGFTPIINYPDLAILGVSRAKNQPQLIDGNLANRLILPFSLTYDHRVIDGADAARFTASLAKLLEKPFLLAKNL